MLRYKKNSDNLDLAHIGDEILAKKASLISDIQSSEIQALIDKMFDTMHKEKGVGLAAPQVNESKQLITIDAEGEKFVFINPTITSRSEDMILFTEGCLSVPGEELPIIRHKKITVKYLDRDGKKCTLKARDFLAVVCQHEVDHLNGVLITDRHKKQEQLRKTLNIS
ncbi:MAG: peptide deformylase [Patescibacteria group bacterium]